MAPYRAVDYCPHLPDELSIFLRALCVSVVIQNNRRSGPMPARRRKVSLAFVGGFL